MLSIILTFIRAFYLRILNKILSMALLRLFQIHFFLLFKYGFEKKCWLYSKLSVDIILLFLFVGLEHNQYMNMVSLLLTLNMFSCWVSSLI